MSVSPGFSHRSADVLTGTYREMQMELLLVSLAFLVVYIVLEVTDTKQ